MVMTGTGADSGMTSGTFRIDGDDKSYTKLSVKNPDNGKTEAYETIIIGNTTYTKDASDGKWWKKVNKETSVDESTADNFKFEIPSATASAEERTTFEKEGKEACGKLTCFKYHSMTGGSSEMTYLWFDDTQYLLRKMEFISSEGEKSTITYQYDNVSVTAPSPTKDAKDDQIIMPNGSTMDMGAGMTQEQIDAMKKVMEDMGTE
jgi:hypothetical protein